MVTGNEYGHGLGYDESGGSTDTANGKDSHVILPTHGVGVDHE